MGFHSQVLRFSDIAERYHIPIDRIGHLKTLSAETVKGMADEAEKIVIATRSQTLETEAIRAREEAA
jgi:hypothetical protein